MKIKKELMEFMGTEQYHKLGMMSNLISTDGITFLMEKAKCFWIHDIIESVQGLPKVKEYKNFIVWKIVKDKKTGGAIVSGYWDCEDDGTYSPSKRVYNQRVTYTDFPFDDLGDYEFYQKGDVLLLKGEY